MRPEGNLEPEKERTRVIEIWNEIRSSLPEISNSDISVNPKTDLTLIGSMTEEIRSECLLPFTSEVEINELFDFGIRFIERIHFFEYDQEKVFFIVDNILDAIWHQKRPQELSDRNKGNLATLSLSILDPRNYKFWELDDFNSPSASNYNHSIYFIFMLEDRFRTENDEFEAVFKHLKPFIMKYGEDHHLSQRWLNRFDRIANNKIKKI